MSTRLSILEFTSQAQAMRDEAPSDFIAAHALFALVKSMADKAQLLRDGVSDDEYVQYGLGQWDRDMARLRSQLAHVMVPTLAELDGPHLADVIRPLLEGVWPARISALPQYATGRVPAKDLLLPPTTTLEAGLFKTQPVVATVGSLWNQAMLASDHDARPTAGDDRASRWLKEVVTDAATYFETRPPEEASDDPDDATLWSDARGLFNRFGELAGDAGSALYDGATSGFGKVLGYTAAGVLTLWAIKLIISR